MRTELVIFDHDGVLVDSEIIAMDILAGISSNFGFSLTRDEAFHRYLGTSFDYVVEDLRGKGATIDRDALHTQFHEDLFEGFRTRLTPIPGIPELLAELTRQQQPIAIASSGNSQRVSLGITSTGIDHFFADSVITTADDVTRGKPFPDLFLTTAERAGIDPAECIVIEDSPFGVEAAHAAGMRVIGFAHQTPAERLSDATWVVSEMSAALAIISDPSFRGA
jgi:HAD superfamily hydrolase (TIGR01509 family)